MVFLSATLPNAFEFAQWVAYIHKAPCHVVYTDYRPTPLLHYAFPTGGGGLYLVCTAAHAEQLGGRAGSAGGECCRGGVSWRLSISLQPGNSTERPMMHALVLVSAVLSVLVPGGGRAREFQV